MPEAIINLPDGRRARLSGPSREAIMQQAQQLTRGPVDPAARRAREAQDLGLPLLEEERTALGIAERPERRASYPMSLGPFGSVNLRGPLATAANAVNNSGDASTPIVLATMGSMAAGPVMTGVAARTAAAPLLSRLPLAARTLLAGPTATALRFGPATLGAGAGGGLGGGLLEAQDPDATPASIAEAASRSAREMATAELLGLGIGAAAAGVVAPMSTSFLGRAAPVVNRIKGAREAVASWLTRAPAETRIVARELAERFPNQAVAARAATDRLQDLLSRTTAMRDGVGVVSGKAVRETWDSLSEPTRVAIGSFEKFTAGIRHVARVANSEAGRELLESAAVPIASAAFGPGAAALIWGVRTLVAPGPLARWFMNSTLPSVTTQTIAGQAVKTAARAGLLDEFQEDEQ
jgi:hypothetical protein